MTEYTMTAEEVGAYLHRDPVLIREMIESKELPIGFVHRYKNRSNVIIPIPLFEEVTKIKVKRPDQAAEQEA